VKLAIDSDLRPVFAVLADVRSISQCLADVMCSDTVVMREICYCSRHFDHTVVGTR